MTLSLLRTPRVTRGRGHVPVLAALALLPALALTACGDDSGTVSTAGSTSSGSPTVPVASPGLGEDPTSGSAVGSATDPGSASEGAAVEGPAVGSGGTGGSGSTGTTAAVPAPTPPAADGSSAVALDPAVASAAQAAASALSGTDWGTVYDLSCAPLVAGRTREAYVAAYGDSSPADLLGGAVTVGEGVDPAGVDAGELPAADGPVAWVRLLHDGDAADQAGVARFAQEASGWRYCGLNG